MNSPRLVLLIMAVIFIAALVRSSLGFGDAVIAMPLIAVSAGLKTAAPLVAFMGPAISVLILARHWQKADLRSAFKLVAASIVGIPLGIYLLTRLPEAPLRMALGVIILLYGRDWIILMQPYWAFTFTVSLAIWRQKKKAR